MRSFRKAFGDAFTLVDLLCVLALMAVLSVMFIGGLARDRERSRRIWCANNLKQLGVAEKTWALDGEGTNRVHRSNALQQLAADGLVFKYFRTFSNELSSPRLLFCPAESNPARKPATSFAGLTNDNQVSYFVGLGGNEETPQMLLNGDRTLSINGVPASHSIHALMTNDIVAWTQAGHQGQGNILLCDGSVQAVSSPRLQGLIIDSVTNCLAFP